MCTSMRLVAQDGSPVVGRTMEFPSLMDAHLSVIPRGLALASASPEGVGAQWTAAYGMVGIDAFPSLMAGGNYAYTDGLNEQGMYGGLLYHPGFCAYPNTKGVEPSALLTPVHVIAYVLTTCATVDEAKSALERVTVWDWKPPVPVTLATHFRFDDANGKGIVVEWESGSLRIFDNPIGVMTNAPSFDWHLTNLRNYMNLRPLQPTAPTINGVALDPIGIGAGMLGLPGDSTPPSRFVRATAMVASAKPTANAAEAEQMMLHLINNFDLPDGLAQTADNPPSADVTYWTTISNLHDRVFSVRTIADHTFRAIDLRDVDFTGTEIRSFELPGASPFPRWSLA